MIDQEKEYLPWEECSSSCSISIEEMKPDSTLINLRCPSTKRRDTKRKNTQKWEGKREKKNPGEKESLLGVDRHLLLLLHAKKEKV